MSSLVSRNDEVVRVEPQVDRMVVLVAGLSILIRRTGSNEAPTVSIEVWPADGEGAAAVASLAVPAPHDDRNCEAAQWHRGRHR